MTICALCGFGVGGLVGCIELGFLRDLDLFLFLYSSKLGVSGAFPFLNGPVFIIITNAK